MDREKIKKLIPIMQAFADGKQIQYRISPRVSVPCKALEMPEMPVYQDIRWRDFDGEKCDGFCCDDTVQYRIKAEPKYRPFKSQEECWDEMHKHPDFGYIKNIVRYEIVQIMRISDEVLNVLDYTISPYAFELAFQTFVFTDGEPFGVKEE